MDCRRLLVVGKDCGVTRRPETDIARPVVAWLAAQGWTVYQEVEHSGRVADIVATLGPLLWVIECKAQLGLAVLGQALGWQYRAHLVSVAGPALPQRSAEIAFHALLVARGIGCLIVRGGGLRVDEHRRPDLTRRLVPGLRAALRPEHQTWAEAGNASSSRYTPWRATVDAVERYVVEHPGATLREVLGAVQTHYSSDKVARATIAAQIRSGLIAGLRCEAAGRELRVWTRERAA